MQAERPALHLVFPAIQVCQSVSVGNATQEQAAQQYTQNYSGQPL
jgi:hypothetical protein